MSASDSHSNTSQKPSEPVNKKIFARQKLSHLSTLQFQELIIDIYDELTRRKNNNTVANESESL